MDVVHNSLHISYGCGTQQSTHHIRHFFLFLSVLLNVTYNVFPAYASIINVVSLARLLLAVFDTTTVVPPSVQSAASRYPFNLPGASMEMVHCCHPCSPGWCCAALCITPRVWKHLTYLLGSASKVDPTSFFLQSAILQNINVLINE